MSVTCEKDNNDFTKLHIKQEIDKEEEKVELEKTTKTLENVEENEDNSSNPNVNDVDNKVAMACESDETFVNNSESDNDENKSGELSFGRKNRRKRDMKTIDNIVIPYKRACRGRRNCNAFSKLDENVTTLTKADNLLCEEYNSKTNKLLFTSGLFYKVVETDAPKKDPKNVIAVCLNCNVHIRGSLRVSSNFLSHMKAKHPEKLKEFNELKTDVRKITFREKYTPKTQEFNFYQKVLNFLSSNYYPLSTIQNKYFVDLFEQTHFPLLTEPSISNMLLTECHNFTEIIKKHLSDVTYVCTSVDIFSTKFHLFFIYGCYWIGADFKRKTAILTCNQVYGPINQDTINSFIIEVNSRFNLDNKKILSVTTNNVVSAKEFVKNMGIRQIGITNDDANDEHEKLNDEIDFSGKIKFHKVDLETVHNLRCPFRNFDVNEKLSLFDIIKRHPQFHRQHLFVLQRVFLFWEFCGNSNFAQLLKNFVNGVWSKPIFSSWSNVYKSLKNIFNIQDVLSSINNELKIGNLEGDEYHYLADYLKILESLTDAFDFLLRDNKMFYGKMFPSLITVEVKLRKLLNSKSLVILQAVCQELHYQLLEQFDDFFQLKKTAYDALVASVCIPSVKTSFLTNLPAYSANDIVDLLSFYAEELYNEENLNDNTLNCNEEEHKNEDFKSEHDFLDFGNKENDAKLKIISIKHEISAYLADESIKSLTLLKKYPLMCRLFYKYNTCLPMKSFVERTLETVGIVEGNDSPTFIDDNFERMVFYRYFKEHKL